MPNICISVLSEEHFYSSKRLYLPLRRHENVISVNANANVIFTKDLQQNLVRHEVYTLYDIGLHYPFIGSSSQKISIYTKCMFQSVEYVRSKPGKKRLHRLLNYQGVQSQILHSSELNTRRWKEHESMKNKTKSG